MEQDNYHSEHDPYSADSLNRQLPEDGRRPLDHEGYYMDYRSSYENSDFYEENSQTYHHNTDRISRPANQYGTVSMILGIIGLITAFSCCCSLISILFGISGLIFGILAREEDGSKGTSAIAGIIMSVITILAFAGMIAFYTFSLLPELNTTTGLQI